MTRRRWLGEGWKNTWTRAQLATLVCNGKKHYLPRHQKIRTTFARQNPYSYVKMAPSATTPEENTILAADPQVISLRKVLTSETEPLARRFRALFSLKHLASLSPPTFQTLLAIDAIAAAFNSPSALLKHELAYCLGQSRNAASVPYLRHEIGRAHV